MSRTTTRSRRVPSASQGPSQSQNGRRSSQYQSQKTRSRRERADEEEEEPENEDADQDEEDVDMEDASDNDLTRKAASLVRLALFTEQRRTALKREEIGKKVLGGQSRSFKIVLELAQEMLRKTFGMELVELQSRDPDAEEDDTTATGIKKKAVPANLRSYILRSTLHPDIIEHAAMTDQQLQKKEVDEKKEAQGDDDDIDEAPESYGTIIKWAQTDNLGAIGVLYTLLALILVNNRVLSDVELRANLRRLKLPAVSGKINFPAHNTVESVTIENYLSTLLRQNYLERVAIGTDAGAGAAKNKSKGKRGRVDLGGDADGDGMSSSTSAWEWRWGSRAHSEVGEKAVAQWIAEFMVGDDDDEEEGEGEDAARAAREEKMLTGVTRAAGGGLSDLW